MARRAEKIAHDYSTEWSMDKELEDEKAVKEIKRHERRKHKKRVEEEEEEDEDDERVK